MIKISMKKGGRKRIRECKRDTEKGKWESKRKEKRVQEEGEKMKGKKSEKWRKKGS